MTAIVGYGNTLRGEDAFGVDVINALKTHHLEDIRLVEAFQLTPELCLELLEANRVIFIDAAYSEDTQYTLACLIEPETQVNLTHHISIKLLREMLKNLYGHTPSMEVVSMLTNSFENIKDEKCYKNCVEKTVQYIKEIV